MLWARLSESHCSSALCVTGLEGVLGAVTMGLAVAMGLDPHLTPLSSPGCLLGFISLPHGCPAPGLGTGEGSVQLSREVCWLVCEGRGTGWAGLSK